MKTQPSRRALPAFTLVEMMIVISVLVSLTSLVATSARTWKRNAHRATCLQEMHDVQLEVRSYQSMYGYGPGMFQASDNNGVTDIVQHMRGRDLIDKEHYALVMAKRNCAGGGWYSRSEPDRFPLPGVAYLSCSLAGSGEKHTPDSLDDW